MTAIIEKQQEQSVSDLGVVAAARFAASHRLESKSRSINFMLSLLAASVVVTLVLPVIYEFNRPTELSIFLADLSASIFVLVLSLYQYGSKDDVNAEKFLQNGIKISEIKRDIQYADIAEFADFRPFMDKYAAILRECGVNHEPIDFIRARLTRSRLGEDTYKDGPVRRFYDNSMSLVRRAPALAVISAIVLLGVIIVTWHALTLIYPQLNLMRWFGGQ